MSSMAGFRTKANPSTTKGMADYGIGAKLLLQMGYQPGKGLGKDLQGNFFMRSTMYRICIN